MERKIELKHGRTPLLFGIHDANLHYLEEQLGVRITTDDATVTIAGEPEATLLAERLLDGAYSLLNQVSALTWLILAFSSVSSKVEKTSRPKHSG